jgi:hypothetical protein
VNEPLSAVLDGLVILARDDLSPRIDELASVLPVAAIAIERVGQAWSGSNMGPRAAMYYGEFEPPPAERHWDASWGFLNPHPGWQRRTDDELEAAVSNAVGRAFAEIVLRAEALDVHVEEVQHGAILAFDEAGDLVGRSGTLRQRQQDLLDLPAAIDVEATMRGWMLSSRTSRDMASFAAPTAPGPHQRLQAHVLRAQSITRRASALLRRLERAAAAARSEPTSRLSASCINLAPDHDGSGTGRSEEHGGNPTNPPPGQSVSVESRAALPTVEPGDSVPRAAGARQDPPYYQIRQDGGIPHHPRCGWAAWRGSLALETARYPISEATGPVGTLIWTCQICGARAIWLRDALQPDPVEDARQRRWAEQTGQTAQSVVDAGEPGPPGADDSVAHEPHRRHRRGRPAWDAQVFHERYREAAALTPRPHTGPAVAQHFRPLAYDVAIGPGIDPARLNTLIRKFGLPPDYRPD